MTAQPALAIEAVGLEKSVGDTRAVAGVDLAAVFLPVTTRLYRSR